MLLDPRSRAFEDVDEDVEALGDVGEEVLYEGDDVSVHQQLPLEMDRSKLCVRWGDWGHARRLTTALQPTYTKIK